MNYAVLTLLGCAFLVLGWLVYEAFSAPFMDESFDDDDSDDYGV
jgi:hypothetical protein